MPTLSDIAHSHSNLIILLLVKTMWNIIDLGEFFFNERIKESATSMFTDLSRDTIKGLSYEALFGL